MNKRRLLCLLLCVVMVASLAVPGTLAIGSATTGSIKVTQNGEKVTSVAVPQNGTATLTASGAGSYQWQILAGDTWVNIQGETDAEIRLSFAMVATLLPTSVRCVSDGAESKAVEVYLGDAPESQPADAVSTYTVIKEATEIGNSEETVDIDALMEEISVAEAEVEEKEATLADAREAETIAKSAYETAKANAEALAPQTETQAEPAVTDGPSADDGATEASGEAPADNSNYEAAVAEADQAKTILDEATAAREDAEAAYTAACDKRDALNGQAQQIMAGVSAYADGDNPSAPEQVVIQIDYLMRKDTTIKVADSYVIRISKGSDFNRTIQSPVIVGYKADQTEVSLDLKDVQEDKTIKVLYEPDVVDYKVEHWQQNADNDDYYTLVRTDDKTGYTEAAVGKGLEMSEADRPGFVNQWYDDTTTIAADGTTTIKIKYDRQYYLMKFDMDGGYGTEPIYARYGATIIQPTAPTRAGYTFDGWEPQVPATMPLYGGTYKAKWIAGDSAKVTVVFWGENPNDEEYSYLSSYDIQRTPGETLTYDSLDAAVHTHGASCYPGAGTTANRVNGPDNPVDGLVYRGTSWGSSYSYIYIGGQWYNYNGSASNGDIVASTCGKMDSKLWQYAKSDTITVAADGSSVMNVSFDRTEFTLTFRQYISSGWSGSWQTVTTITRKWGADIHSNFPIKDGSDTMWWEVPDDCVSMKPGTTFGSLDTMPAENITFDYDEKTSAATLHYYVEVLPGETGTYTHDGKNFKLYKDINISRSGHLTYTEEFHDIIGFKQWWSNPKFDKHEQGGTTNGINNDNYLCYTRNVYDIVYFNPTSQIKTDENVPYEMPLSGYYWEPTADQAPSHYEPGSVKFGGWYLNPECSGEKFDFTTATMPSGATNTSGEVALSLYAKWVPVTHTVNFYTSDNMTTLHKGPYTVPHGEILPEKVEAPTNGAMYFVGWFYKDGDTEKAFDPDNMPITKDLDLYAKWSATKPMPYTVYYKIQGTDTEVAAPSNGAALVESTKTLEAKTGAELYADYRTGYYPVVGSHNIKMDSTQEKIEYTFEYVAMPEVWYKVQYLEKDTNKVLKEEVIKSTHDAVITENYAYIEGYTPLTVSQRLILAAEGKDNIQENVLIFYYEEDHDNVSAQVNHWLMDPETGEYTILKSTLGIPKVKKGSTHTEHYLNPIPTGYKFSHAEAVDTTETPDKIADVTVGTDGVSLTVPDKGFILNLYYECEKYPYVFHFVNEETGEKIAADVTGTENYGKLIQHTAPTSIDCYDLVDNANHSFYIDSDETKNEHTFLYREKQVVINYVAVGPEGVTDFGSVSPETETVKAKSEDAKGSTATANGNTYRFVGWYSDPDCSIKVSDDATYIPQKVDGLNVAATYYAKFEYNLTSLTIKKLGTPYDNSDRFIIDIVGSDGKKTTVTIASGGEVTISGLTVGETYTVTERTTGTRYSASYSNQSITLAPKDNTVTITNTVTTNTWLTSSKTVKNEFTKG